MNKTASSFSEDIFFLHFPRHFFIMTLKTDDLMTLTERTCIMKQKLLETAILFFLLCQKVSSLSSLRQKELHFMNDHVHSLLQNRPFIRGGGFVSSSGTHRTNKSNLSISSHKFSIIGDIYSSNDINEDEKENKKEEKEVDMIEHHNTPITTNHENVHHSRLLFPFFIKKFLADLMSSKSATILGQVVVTGIIYASAANVGIYHYRNMKICWRRIIICLTETTSIQCQNWKLLLGVLAKTLVKKRSFVKRRAIGNSNGSVSSLEMDKSDDSSMYYDYDIVRLSDLDACVS